MSYSNIPLNNLQNQNLTYAFLKVHIDKIDICRLLELKFRFLFLM